MSKAGFLGSLGLGYPLSSPSEPSWGTSQSLLRVRVKVRVRVGVRVGAGVRWEGSL